MILVADNLQITNKIIEKGVSELNPEPIQAMVKRFESAGADAIDINSGPFYRDPEEKMTFLVSTIQEISDLPVVIDTANPVALRAGLRANRKTAIINGFSLEPAKIEKILPLAKEFESDIIGYLLYPDGHVPPDEEERLNIACELVSLCQNKAGIDKERLIIDPVLVPIAWENGNSHAMDVLSVIKYLPELLGFPVRTIIGLSNLTTGSGYSEKKLFLERTYLPMLAVSGLNMVLLNIFHPETVRVAKACGPLMDKRIFTWEEI